MQAGAFTTSRTPRGWRPGESADRRYFRTSYDDDDSVVCRRCSSATRFAFSCRQRLISLLLIDRCSLGNPNDTRRIIPIQLAIKRSNLVEKYQGNDVTMRFGNLEASIHVASKESTLLTTGTPPQCSRVSSDLVGSKSDFGEAEIADCGLYLGEAHGSDISTTLPFDRSCL